MTLVIGIDDAGRGPIIGSMVLAGVRITKEQEEIIKNEGATDSKLLAHSSRIRIAEVIKEKADAYKIISSSPDEIDAALNNPGTNLNRLEAQKAAEIINALNNGENMTVVVDCPSVNTEAWKQTMLEYVKDTSNLVIKCEHKADLNHVSAAAASILAKVNREDEVLAIKKKYGDIGSGYPSDPTTKAFLKKHGRELADSGIFRKSWSTWKRFFPEKSQASLQDF